MNLTDPPLTNRQQLIDHFQDSVRLPEWQRIGLSAQRFLLAAEDGSFLPYKGTRSLSAFLHQLADSDGWQLHTEADNIIGVTKDGSAVTLGPGGQITFVNQGRSNLHEIAADLENAEKAWATNAEQLGARIVALGHHPTATARAAPEIPRQYYKILDETLSRKPSLASALQKCVASTAVRFDYASEEDMIKKIKIALALQPIATALLANSPLLEGIATVYHSYRAHVRLQVDPAAKTIYRLVLQPDFSFGSYADHMLAMPLTHVYRSGMASAINSGDFIAFMQGHLAELPDEYPRHQDWVQHLASSITEVRLVPELYLAGADSAPKDLTLALAAFWTGILYDAGALNDSLRFIKDWTAEELIEMRSLVAERGLKTPFRGGRLDEVATEAVKLAQQGLRRRAIRLNGGADETRYVEPLFLIAESAQTPADKLRMLVQTDGIKTALRSVM